VRGERLDLRVNQNHTLRKIQLISIQPAKGGRGGGGGRLVFQFSVPGGFTGSRARREGARLRSSGKGSPKASLPASKGEGRFWKKQLFFRSEGGRPLGNLRILFSLRKSPKIRGEGRPDLAPIPWQAARAGEKFSPENRPSAAKGPVQGGAGLVSFGQFAQLIYMARAASAGCRGLY